MAIVYGSILPQIKRPETPEELAICDGLWNEVSRAIFADAELMSIRDGGKVRLLVFNSHKTPDVRWADWLLASVNVHIPSVGTLTWIARLRSIDEKTNTWYLGTRENKYDHMMSRFACRYMSCPSSITLGVWRPQGEVATRTIPLLH